jgi:hypothetical protein
MYVPVAVRLTIVIFALRHAWDTRTMEDNESGRPSRKTPADVATRRAAKLLVAPVQDQLGIWQAESVKFETMAERARATGRRNEQLASDIRQVLDAITQQISALDGAIANAPEPVQMHSRVTDVQKVIRMLEQRLNETLNGLEPPSKG